MNHMTQHNHQQMAKPQTGHDMSDMHASHDRHAGHCLAMFRDKFWLSLILTFPVLFWSADVQRWFGYVAPSFPGSGFIPVILGTVVFFYGGLVFIRGAWGELVDRKPGMMTLISLGIIVAFGTSLAGTFGLFELEVLVGTRITDHDHDPWSLVRNAGCFPIARRARLIVDRHPGEKGLAFLRDTELRSASARMPHAASHLTHFATAEV